MKRPTVGFAAASALSAAALPIHVTALIPSSDMWRAPTTRRASALFGMLPRGGGGWGEGAGGGDGGGGDDVEAARRRLEAIMGGAGPSTDDDIDDESEYAKRKAKIKRRASPSSVPLPDASSVPRPPLTTIGRERREAEIDLLSSLDDGDEAVSDLWSLWFNERGPGPARDLLRAEDLASQGPRQWADAEERLRAMIEEHGVHWAEPINRLATLLYVQGRLEESRKMCESVLSVKPWHFGALSGIVLVCAGLGDSPSARMWAARRLPPLRPDGIVDNGRRREWVERAVNDALDALEEAEEDTRLSFGESEEDWIARNTGRLVNEEEEIDLVVEDNDEDESEEDTFEDAWQ